MITQFRNFAKSPYAIVLIVVLSAAVALTFIPDMFRSGGTAVVLIGSEKVTVADLSESYDRELRSLQQESDFWTRDMAVAAGVPQNVLGQLVSQAAMISKANELGLGASINDVAEALRETTFFQSSVTGRYDLGRAIELLQNNRLNPARYEEGVRRDLVLYQLLSSVQAGLAPPADYIENDFAFTEETRDLRAFVPAAIPTRDIEDPGDEALTQVVLDNPDYLFEGTPAFSVPERRAFTLVRFQLEDFISQVEVDEEELQRNYEFYIDVGQLGTPANRSWTQVYFSEQADAEAAAERVAAGEDIAAVALDLNGGDPITREEVLAGDVPDTALRDALFAMQAGDTQAVEGSVGWFAVSVTGGVEEDIPSFEEARPDLFREVAELEAENAQGEMLDAFELLLIDGATLEEAAEASGATLETFPLVARNGTDENGRAVAELAAPGGSEILEALFNHIPGVPMDVESYNEGENTRDFFTLRIDDLVEGRARALDEGAVRRIALLKYREDEVRARRAAIAEQALERIRAGEDMQAVADALGGSVEAAVMPRFLRQPNGPWNQTVVGSAYAIGAGEAIQPVDQSGPLPVVVQVDAINAVDVAAMPIERRVQGNFQIRQTVESDLLESMIASLRAEYGYSDADIDQRLFLQAIGESPDQR